jgi:hypothetical protein
MALTLKCTVCGGPTHADAGALRRGFSSCRSCGTFHRVTKEGLAAAPPADILESVPDGVLVKDGPDLLSFTARVAGGANHAFGRELLSGLIVAVAAAYGASRVAPQWFIIPIAGLVAFLFTLLFVGKLRRFPPPVTISGKLVRSGVRLTKIPVDDVAQVYTTEFNPNFGPLAAQAAEVQKQQGKFQEVFWVCALRKDGRRVQLLGPLAELAHAVYVEERLEAALGLADRSVAGQLSSSDGPEAHTEDTLPCEGCGADQPVDAGARSRGFVLCTYCRTATVVKTGGAMGDALGEKKDPRFRVVDGDTLRVEPVDGGEPVVVVTADAVETKSASYPISKVEDVMVRAAGGPSVKDVIGALGKVGELSAYTARDAGDAAALVTDMLNMELQVAARVKGKGEVVLIEAVEDPREAFELIEKIRGRIQL